MTRIGHLRRVSRSGRGLNAEWYAKATDASAQALMSDAYSSACATVRTTTRTPGCPARGSIEHQSFAQVVLPAPSSAGITGRGRDGFDICWFSVSAIWCHASSRAGEQTFPYSSHFARIDATKAVGEITTLTPHRCTS